MSLEEMNAVLKEMAEEVKKKDNFVVVSHHDADGVSAGAIIAKALKRLGKKFQSLTIKQLYSDTLNDIGEMGENFIFADFGSGQLRELVEFFPDSNFFVLDHHQPVPVSYRFHANPILFGFSGNDELSGSGISYLFAKHLDEKNYDLSALAIVGAVGDMQDFSGKLIGLNKEILQDAIDHKLIDREIDLRLYGRISRPLTQFLMFSSNPIIPDITANKANTEKFLNDIGLLLHDGTKWLAYSNLTFEQKRQLSTALFLHLQKHNVPEWKLKELIGEVYTLLREDPSSPLRDAKEFATLLNSCGRHGRAEIGLAVCMGDRNEQYSCALDLLREHRRQLRQGIEMMQKQGVEEFDQFYFFDAGDTIMDSLVGIVAGMLYGAGSIQPDKPIIAFARYDDETIKASARANKDLIRRGLHLGTILKEIGRELGGIAEGGGHAIAAGMRLHVNQKDDFLRKLNEKIAQSLK